MASGAPIHAEALAAALSGAAKAVPPGYVEDPSQSGDSGGSTQTQSGGAPPSVGGGQDAQSPDQAGGQAGGDPQEEQAVWSEFPSTDPNAVQGLLQQMQSASPEDLVQMVGQWLQQRDADHQKMDQMQEAVFSGLFDQLGGMAPGGQAAAGPEGPSPVSAGPGVGGAGAGY